MKGKISKIISIFVLSTMIYACDSDSDENDVLTLSDIHGLWKLENTIHYFFIDKDQEIIFYLRDDLGVNCLTEWDSEEVAVVDGELFTFDSDSSLEESQENDEGSPIQIVGNTLIITDSDTDQPTGYEFVSNDIFDEQICD